MSLFYVVFVGISPQGGAILLLTGPSGCGKTATVQVLAKDLGFHIQEWSNPSTTSQYKMEDLFTQSFDPGQECFLLTSNVHVAKPCIMTSERELFSNPIFNI